MSKLNNLTQEASDRAETRGSSSQSRSPGGKNISQFSDNVDQQAENVIRLEEQLRTLGKQLLRKQESLEEYLSERAALKVRLQDSQRRCQKYEDQVNALLEAADPYDYEANAGGGEGFSVGMNHPRDLGNRKLRQRGGGVGGGGSDRLSRPVRASQDLEKLGVHASPGVNKAVDMIDTWTLITGRHLKAYPLLRLTFVFYLLLIHLWAFCLLAYHAHLIDMDNANASNMTNNKLG